MRDGDRVASGEAQSGAVGPEYRDRRARGACGEAVGNDRGDVGVGRGNRAAVHLIGNRAGTVAADAGEESRAAFGIAHVAVSDRAEREMHISGQRPTQSHTHGREIRRSRLGASLPLNLALAGGWSE